MVDSVRLTRLLRAISDSVVTLTREQQADDARRNDPLWLPGIKYLMIAAVESCIDAAQHIVSGEKWETPADNGAAMRLLAQHGVIAPTTGDAMRRAVGFRNVLVHEYVSVNDDVVIARLADLSDLESFVAEVAAWLQRA